MNQFYLKLLIKQLNLTQYPNRIHQKTSPLKDLIIACNISIKKKRRTGIPVVHDSISIDRNLHERFSSHCLVIPLPEWFRCRHNCILTKFSMLESFASYLRNKGDNYNRILNKIEEIQHYESQGRPKSSTMMIRFSLLLRYSSYQVYKLLLEELPLLSLSY